LKKPFPGDKGIYCFFIIAVKRPGFNIVKGEAVYILDGIHMNRFAVSANISLSGNQKSPGVPGPIRLIMYP
jgi:hypothetical protein